jgi:glycosyltransferase involved in cell wall biosynthesis
MRTTADPADGIEERDPSVRPIRVLHVINGLGTGGAERSLLESLSLLQSRRVRPMVVSLFRRNEGVEDRVLSSGVPVTFLTSRSLIPRVRELRAIIGRSRPDIVHTTIFEADVVGRLGARGLPVRVISSLVNTSYDSVRLTDPRISRVRLNAARAIDGWTARRYVDHFHAITHSVKHAAIRDLGLAPDRITVIERGRDPGRLIPANGERRLAARLALGLRPEDEVLVTVGRQEFQKGQRYLLDAMRSIGDSRPTAVLLIAGREGAATSELRRVHAASGLGDRIRFLGNRDDLPQILAAADIFVFPSLYEGLGGSVIEAMAMRLPVIASDLEALREVVEDGGSGLLVPRGSAAGLSRTIVELLTDASVRGRLGARGRDLFEQRFTIDRSVERMVGLYRAVAGGGGSRG